jgi:hypothetical protein
MWGTGNYPIEIVELSNYMNDADEYFEAEENEALRSFLAFNPESGNVLEGTGGIRVLQWRAKKTGRTARVVYYFRDLNMPLYILALYKRASPLSDKLRAELKASVDEIVAQYGEEWQTIILRQLSGGKEPA